MKILITSNNIIQVYRAPNILEEHIASHLKNRVVFRRTMKMVMESIGRTSDKCIKVQITKQLVVVKWLESNGIKKVLQLTQRSST